MATRESHYLMFARVNPESVDKQRIRLIALATPSRDVYNILNLCL